MLSIIINNIELLYIKNLNPNTFHLEFNFNVGYNHSQKSQVPHILEHLIATFSKEANEKRKNDAAAKAAEAAAEATAEQAEAEAPAEENNETEA